MLVGVNDVWKYVITCAETHKHEDGCQCDRPEIRATFRNGHCSREQILRCHGGENLKMWEEARIQPLTLEGNDGSDYNPMVKKMTNTMKGMATSPQGPAPMLKCVQCDFTQPVPMHCGQPMHQEGNMLVCWMGATCGQQPFPTHHGQQMKLA